MFPSRVFRIDPGLAGRLHKFLLGTDERPESFRQESGIEWLFERFVDTRTIKAHRVAVIGKQSDQDDLGEVGILAKVLANLQRFQLAD